MKKRITKKTVCVIMSMALMFGSVMITHASTPICGGNHKYDIPVTHVGYEAVSDAYRCGTHSNCWCVDTRETYLMRCACGAEKVIMVGPIIVRHRSTN